MKDVINLPISENAEQIVLSGLISDVHFSKKCLGNIQEEDFSNEINQSIFKTIKYLKPPIEIGKILNELKNTDIERRLGGTQQLIAALMHLQLQSSADFEYYLKEVKDSSSKRKIIKEYQKLLKHIQDGNTAEEIIIKYKAMFDNISSSIAVDERYKIKSISQQDKNWLLVDPPSKPMLLDYTEGVYVKGFLPKSIVGLLIGLGGVGKTHLIAQMALAIASGRPFLDMFHPTNHCGERNSGNVFLGLGENQDDDIWRLLYKASKRFRDDKYGEEELRRVSQHIHTLSFNGKPTAFLDSNGKPTAAFFEFKSSLINSASLNGGYALIVLDPISRFLGPEAEKDNATATTFITLMESLTIDVHGHPTVLLSHHMNKTGGANEGMGQDAARGATALVDGARWVINLTSKKNEGKTKTLNLSKSNFTPFFEDIALVQERDGYLVHEKAASSSGINSFPRINSDGDEIIADKNMLLN